VPGFFLPARFPASAFGKLSPSKKESAMKRIAVAVITLALLGLPLVQAGNAEVNVNINVGAPPLPLPPPLPFPEPPRIVLSAPPEFILPPALGFYVAVGVPHDIVFIDNTYYLYRDNRWFRAPYYNGPWRNVERRQLPPGLRKHKFERIRYYRDSEYNRYRGDHDRYRGRHFKPDKEWKEERKEERREMRRDEKEHRREERRHDKEERRNEKEERKMDRDEERGHGRHGVHN
jgi:YXWGXW repeat-containing protein